MNPNPNADVERFMKSSDMEDAVAEKAQAVFPDAWELAVATEDEELFQKVWNESTRLVLDDIITSLIEKGFVEAHGMTDDGEMSFGLTSAGKDVVIEGDGNDRRP